MLEIEADAGGANPDLRGFLLLFKIGFEEERGEGDE